MTRATYDYGQVPENTVSGDQTFTVTNTSQATSGTVAVSLGGPDASDFVIDSNTYGSGLPGGGSCTVTVHFTPGSTGNAYREPVGHGRARRHGNRVAARGRAGGGRPVHRPNLV